MTSVLSTNIISPLGCTTSQNYQAVRSGCSALRCHEGMWNLPEPFCASLFSKQQRSGLVMDGCTFFESIAIRSAREALGRTSFDAASSRVVLILSTAKGNVSLLEDGQDTESVCLGVTAGKIASALGITTEPVVVSNACMSGVAALITAQRLLDLGRYDYAVVVGAEVQSLFIVSGFQSFKSLSAEPCRPFDIERLGLNLGEGAATMVLSAKEEGNGAWVIQDGRIRSDAYHLSSPHPQGEGCRLALEGVSGGAVPAMLGVHGTATMYNDQMESRAIERAGLSSVPLTCLKGCFGHTMGAAGILETIIMMRAMEDGLALGVRGFGEIGVSGKINISSQDRPVTGDTFVKILSGFGGCNGAVRLSRGSAATAGEKVSEAATRVLHSVDVDENGAFVDGVRLQTSEKGRDLLTGLYRSWIGDYPKYYKMDALTRLSFVASELLLKAEGSAPKECRDRAVILFNRSSSIISDRHHCDTVRKDSLASPAVFLYTLPNLTTAEIAIRNHYHGETSFYILPERNEALMADIISASLLDPETTSALTGWVDCPEADRFEAHLSLIERT